MVTEKWVKWAASEMTAPLSLRLLDMDGLVSLEVTPYGLEIHSCTAPLTKEQVRRVAAVLLTWAGPRPCEVSCAQCGGTGFQK